MKYPKKFLALALVALSVMAVALPAFAQTDTFKVNPGQSTSDTHSFYADANDFGNSATWSISLSITSSTSTGGILDTATVYLDSHDPKRVTATNDGWVRRGTINLTDMNTHNYSYLLNSCDKVRITVKCPSTNRGTTHVTATW